jgi:hypothetical protein
MPALYIHINTFINVYFLGRGSTSTKFGLHIGKKKFNGQNEELISVFLMTHIILPV